MPSSTRLPNAASVALIDRDRVLLIQRARAPWSGLWSLPGGRLEQGETAEQAAAREVLEEVGLRAFALRPLRRMILGDGRFVLQVFATEAFEGEVVAAAAEISDHRWVRLDDIAFMPTTPDLAEVVAGAFRIFDRS
jgi:8-oxo-dGTP diphosphatase